MPEGVAARPGRIYFASFPENCLAVSVFGWHPCVGHAALVTQDKAGLVKQYDYGWFVGSGGGRPEDAIGYVDEGPSYGVVRRQAFDAARGEGHFLDLLWGGFPGADAPSIGTEKTVYAR